MYKDNGRVRLAKQPDAEYVLTTDKLCKRYKHVYAARDIDIRIRRGEIYGLIGRNGAGKTTIMRVLSGLSNATSGSYSLFGKTGREIRSVMGQVGALIEAPGIYANLNAVDNLRMKCIALNCDKPGYAEQLLELVGLSDTGKKPAGAFSLGMRQRLGIALAVVGDPKLVILDEPINGLDPQGIVDVRNILTRLRDERGMTIMISSHILDELGKFADCYGIINEGRLIDEFTRQDIQQRTGSFTVVSTDNNEKALAVIRDMSGLSAEIDGEKRIKITGEISRSANVVKCLVENDIFVREIKTESFSLEDYYLSVTRGGTTNA